MTDDQAGFYSISVSITTSSTLDSLIDNAVLETGDTVRVRACTVDYKSTPLGLAAIASTLYLVSQTLGPDYLYTVNTTTGAATRAGALGSMIREGWPLAAQPSTWLTPPKTASTR